MLKAEVIETLLYGCVTWSPNKPDCDRLRQIRHSMPLRCLDWWKRKRDGRTLSYANAVDGTLLYANALAKTDSKSIEVTKRKRRIFFCGIRVTYEGGTSTTKGHVWGAGWG